MLRPLTLLVLCQFVGEVIARFAHLPLPGPVIGLVLLLAFLIARRGPDPDLRDVGGGLLRHLSLLFVPAGVGIVTQLDTLRENWLPIAAAILGSTVLGMAVTAIIMQRLVTRE